MQLIPWITVVTVLVLSVGWATFSQTLEIDDVKVVFRTQADIRITGISVFDTNQASSNWEEYNIKRIQTSINLPEKDSQIKYKVQITNFGNVDMGIFNITGLPNNLEYELEDYDLKEKICVEDGCKLGIQKDIYIIIKYKDGVEPQGNTDFIISLDFDFRSFHNVTYKGFLNTNPYPSEIMDKDNLKVTFTEKMQKDDLYVTIGGMNTRDFDFTDNTLSLNSIEDDIVITNFKFSVLARLSNVTFPRTDDAKDFDEILTDTTNFNIVLKNNDGTNFNHIDGDYKVEIVNNEKFELNGVTTGTLTSDSLKDQDMSLTLHIKDFTSTLDKFKLRVTLLSPISKTYELDFTVKQDGAIQYIEDLVDMSLAIRAKKNPNNLGTADIQNQRFKLTRDLDFNNMSHYKDPTSNAYGDINGNDISANIYGELTSDTGFLPIGELSHPFQGVFHGGDHKISNLGIQKSLQINIGFFGTLKNATVKNLTFVDGNVTNHNQTAGMVAGKVYGGTIENVTVTGGSVISMDEVSMTEDTYSGGIAGYVTDGATIKNCTNSARVSTNFVGDTNTYSGPAGGITAWMSHSTIDHCINYGEITGQSYIGGIAGFSGMQLDGGNSDSVGGGTIQNCENHGYIHYYVPSGSLPTNWGKHVGGIAGYNKKGGIIDNNTNFPEAKIESITNGGGIVGNNATGGTVTNNKNQSTHITGTKHGGVVGAGTYSSNNSTVTVN